MKYKILKIVFLVWVIVWIFFIARELFVKDNLSDYRKLLPLSLEGKRSYVTGDSLYEFITFCKKRLPGNITYRLMGLHDDSLAKKRAVYYLYPRLERRKGVDFVLVFDRPIFEDIGYDMPFKLDDRRYVLKIK